MPDRPESPITLSAPVTLSDELPADRDPSRQAALPDEGSGRREQPELPAAMHALDVLLELAALEAKAIRDASGDELRLRAAALAWYGRGDAARCAHFLEGLEHPVADALRFDLASELQDDASLLALTTAALWRADEPRLRAAGAYFLYRGQADRAIEALQGAGPGGREDLALAHHLAGRWAELRALYASDSSPEGLLAAACISQDRMDDVAAAREHLRSAFAAAPHGSAAADDPYLLERLLEVDVEAAEALRRKIDLLTAEPTALAERAAAQYLLSMRLGATLESAALLAGLCAAVPAGDTDFGASLALQARAAVEAALGDAREAANAWLARADGSGLPRWAAALRRRAAELLEARVGDQAAAEALLTGLFAETPGSLPEMRAVVRLQTARGDLAAAASTLTTFARAQHGTPEGRDALLRAARSLEACSRPVAPHVMAVPGRIGEPVAANASALPAELSAELVKRWRAAVGDDGDREPLEALVRVLRRSGDRGGLVTALCGLGAALASPDGDVLGTVAAILALDAGLYEEAARLLDEAITANPGDRLAVFARGLYAPLLGAPEQEVHALSLGAELATASGTRANLWCRIADVRREKFGDAAGAADILRKALELEPDDPGTLRACARLAMDRQAWQEAIELVERAAAAAAVRRPSAEPALRPAALLVEVGGLYERRLSDDERAADAYSRALAADPSSPAALGALAALHRRRGAREPLREVLGRLAPLERDPGVRLALEIERAQVSLETGAVESAIEAYREALRLDASAPGVVDQLVELCRRDERWQVLADALGELVAPSASATGGARAEADALGPRVELSAGTLAALAEAYERLGRTDERVHVLEREVLLLERHGDRAAMAAAARSLAELRETMGDLEGAARAWHRVDDTIDDDVTAARALQRIYAERGRNADLAAAIERELLRLGASSPSSVGRSGSLTVRGPHRELSPAEGARALELWLRLGSVRRSLQKLDAAAEAYEEALRLDAANPAALAALIDVYGAQCRGAELLRVLEARARASGSAADRAAVLLQIGEQRDKLADTEGALSALREAFFLDPGNRAAFTAYERACYRRERWTEAMDLYNRAIKLVEVDKQHAYRLADLYARRGQVELAWLDNAEAAAVSYQRLLELDPDSDNAQNALERIYSGRGDWSRLLDAYERRERRLNDDPKRADILRRAARLAHGELGDTARAISLYQRLHAADPTDVEALDALERHYAETRDHVHLLDVLRTRTALTSGGDEAIALYLRIASLSEEALQDIEKAIEAYEKILDIAPSHSEALDALARLYEGTERWAELVDISRRQLRVISDPQRKALVYFRCGSVMESKFGKDDEAIRYYDVAIKTSASCLPAVHGLRDLYLRREDWPRVIQTLELEARIWSEDKERAGVLAHIGQIYRDKLGDTDRAIEYFESAIGVDRECLPANRALFELYFARKDYVRAWPLGDVLTQKAVREGDPAERSEFYRKRAIVATATSNLRDAAESLVVGLEIRPDNLDALDLLVELCRQQPAAYDFASTFAQLGRLYRKRDGTEQPQPGTLSARLLARVLVAQAALLEGDFDVQGAEGLLTDAQRLAPDDFAIVDARVSLCLRLRRLDVATGLLEEYLGGTSDREARCQARLRLAEIHGDMAMAPVRAVQVLQDLVADEPQLIEAQLRLAQEQYLLGRFVEAGKTCERLIEVATRPGYTAPPDHLARYYHYFGRILEAQGDADAATRCYRRAMDLDPNHPAPVLALARRDATAGDLGRAIGLVQATLVGRKSDGAQSHASSLELTRGLARFHASAGDRGEAVRLLAGIVGRHPESEDDRAMLAELQLLEGNLSGAAAQLREMIARNLRCPPVYRMFVRLYERGGLVERAARAAAISRLLGYAEPGDASLRNFVPQVCRGAISEELRQIRLVPGKARGVWADAFEALREMLDALFPVSLPPDGDPPRDGAFNAAIADVKRLYGLDVEVRLSSVVPGGTMLTESPRPMLFIDAALAERPDGERRFLLGRAFETLRAGTSLLFRLRPTELAQIERLVAELTRPPSARDPELASLLQELPRKSQRIAERLVGAQPEVPFGAWLSAVRQAADRGGLLACDDVAAAARMLARLEGEELAVSDEGVMLLGQVSGVEELIRFFLSDNYHDLRAAVDARVG